MQDLMFLHVSFFMYVYLFYGSVPCLPFLTARIFRSVTPQAKIGVLFHAWNISDFYARGRNIRFFSLAFCAHACLLISRTGILTIFFTLRMFRSVTAYARFFVSFCLPFPRLSTFMRIDTLSTFITMRICCSDTLLN